MMRRSTATNRALSWEDSVQRIYQDCRTDKVFDGRGPEFYDMNWLFLREDRKPRRKAFARGGFADAPTGWEARRESLLRRSHGIAD